MKPIGPLMIEHRLIERMIRLISQEVALIEERADLRPDFIDTAVDFLRTYADRTHHGKEEDILFRDLGEKDLTPDDQKAMTELIEEHKQGRQLVRSVAEATQQYRAGGESRLVSTIRDDLQAIVDFYPQHIEKEDKRFFPASMGYFSDEEQQAMLSECWEFDRKMIHEKYRNIVEQCEQS
jgi:hemerythrin-like domain-containing protein